MALRRSFMRRLSVSIPGAEEVESQIAYKQLLDKRKRAPGLSGWGVNQYMTWLVAGGVILGGAVVLGPWIVDETKAAFGYNATIVDASYLPEYTPEWWENEWRKMLIKWRRGEYVANFHAPSYDYIKSIVGRDMAMEPRQRFAQRVGPSTPPSWWRKLIGQGDGGRKKDIAAALANKPRALVPMCGDSPILRVLTEQGYQVDGVDSSETAIRTAVEKLEAVLPASAFSSLTLHYKNIFAPSLWNNDLAGRQYDFIYDRQALSALNPSQREDYVFLIKQALKDDGILYVEGIFRTGRVKGNKIRGPPFGLSRAQLRDLFPEQEGFFVQCQDAEDNAISLLDTQSKVLRRVPKELHVTTFPCVVFREAGIGAPPAVDSNSSGSSGAVLKL
jgi:SAM-dependent methyltransferase